MTDDALIEAMAKAMSDSGNKDWEHAEDWFKDIYIVQAYAALAVCKPVIEQAERERCAKIALDTYSDTDRMKYTHDTYTSGFSDCKLKIHRAIMGYTND